MKTSGKIIHQKYHNVHIKNKYFLEVSFGFPPSNFRHEFSNILRSFSSCSNLSSTSNNIVEDHHPMVIIQSLDMVQEETSFGAVETNPTKQSAKL